jgi:hypothetical protein
MVPPSRHGLLTIALAATPCYLGRINGTLAQAPLKYRRDVIPPDLVSIVLGPAQGQAGTSRTARPTQRQ